VIVSVGRIAARDGNQVHALPVVELGLLAGARLVARGRFQGSAIPLLSARRSGGD
jgi:hypothetical protein